ncbi:hypothetical protein [Candidatus Tisiphia endosymbiont of Nemotelus uliginosus]|uniref:hypothetical protein n=1 Tax=Candidatus Tisiphia endosymbiont of Nemotelus uliginosus TaxID=3077926 RepID=UPI0035C8F5A1
MNKELDLNLKEVAWGDIRDEIYKINRELAEKCDQSNTYNQHTLFKISYPYGTSIVNEGVFHLPTRDGRLVSIKDPKVPESIRTKLSYSPIPLSFILHNSSEVFVKDKDRVIPLNIFGVGKLFGLFELLNILTHPPITHAPIWNVNAGARSVFMLPSISDMIGHNRIQKKLGSNIHLPYHLVDHWQTFVEINQYSTAKDRWHNTIIVFTNKWFEETNNISYAKFVNYLAIQGWQQLQFGLLGDFTEFSLLWSLFTHEINNRNLKPRPYLIDTIKHLISITKQFGIAFQPSIDDQALPRQLIQQVYVEDYQLKEYIPTIMQPATLVNKKNKLYYSLSLPTLPNSSPYFKNPPSLIEDQREINKLLTILMSIAHKIKHPTAIVMKDIKFRMFHSGHDPFGQIIASKYIADHDSRFLVYNNEHNRTFCWSSTFFNGCISIEYKE